MTALLQTCVRHPPPVLHLSSFVPTAAHVYQAFVSAAVTPDQEFPMELSTLSCRCSRLRTPYQSGEAPLWTATCHSVSLSEQQIHHPRQYARHRQFPGHSP